MFNNFEYIKIFQINFPYTQKNICSHNTCHSIFSISNYLLICSFPLDFSIDFIKQNAKLRNVLHANAENHSGDRNSKNNKVERYIIQVAQTQLSIVRFRRTNLRIK